MLQFNYMRAWLRLHSIADVEHWNENQIIESFMLLPFPRVSFEEWVETLKSAANSKQNEEPEEEEKEDPLERIKRDTHLFRAGMVHMGPPISAEE